MTHSEPRIDELQEQLIQEAFDLLFDGIQRINKLKKKNLQTPISVAFSNFPKQENEMSYYYKQGCVSERKDGRYIARLYLLGKQRQVASGRNKKEVVERLNKIVDLKNQNKIRSLEDLLHVLNDLPLLNDNEPGNSVQTSYTLYSWLDTWLQDYKENKVSNNYFIQLKSNIKVHIKPNIPDCPLTQISALDIQRGLNKIKSSRMRENAYTVLNEAIRKAYVLDFIPKNYMEAVDKKNTTERRAKRLHKISKQILSMPPYKLKSEKFLLFRFTREQDPEKLTSCFGSILTSKRIHALSTEQKTVMQSARFLSSKDFGNCLKRYPELQI